MSGKSETCVFSDIRELSINDCSVEVNGQKSNSASPTDIWMIGLKPGTTIKEGGKFITIPSVFLKYYITPDSWMYFRNKYRLDNVRSEKYFDVLYTKILALEYENKVYTQIVGKIISDKNSPHFIRSFSDKNKCSFDDLLSILLDTDTGDNPKYNLSRNSMYMYYGLQGRPSITDDVHIDFSKMIEKDKNGDETEYVYPWLNFHNMDYNYILNQAIDSTNTKTFLEMLSLVNIQELYICLFQIVQACYTMYKHRLIHNDLHPNNIWVTRRDDVLLNLRYKINSPDSSSVKEYYINNANIMCRIYDYDRSYCETLGDNPYLTGGRIQVGQINKVIRGKDLVKVMCYLYKFLNEAVRDSILGLFTDKRQYWREQFQSKDIYCIVTEFPEDSIYDYPQILDNIYNKITGKGKREQVEYTAYTL